MVPFIIYWASIIISIAWIVISTGFSIYYFSNKEYGNLWAFAFFNVLAAIVLGIVLLVYKTWTFNLNGVPMNTYSSLMIGLIVAELVLAVIKAVLGREPKLAPAK